MSFIIGKVTRKVSKQHNEYFVGKICNLPVRGSWAKKGQDDLCLFVDEPVLSFLSKKNEAKAKAAPQEENKQQQ